MKQPAHTITLKPWGSLGFGERLALEGVTALLWPLRDDERMTVLLTALAHQTAAIVENEDQADAIVDMLRMTLKQELHK